MRQLPFVSLLDHCSVRYRCRDGNEPLPNLSGPDGPFGWFPMRRQAA